MCVGYVSFLCLENYPLSKGYFFSNPFRFCFFFVLANCSSFAFKIDVGNCHKTFFLEPFSLFIVVFSFFFRVVFHFCFVFRFFFVLFMFSCAFSFSSCSF